MFDVCGWIERKKGREEKKNNKIKNYVVLVRRAKDPLLLCAHSLTHSLNTSIDAI